MLAVVLQLYKGRGKSDLYKSLSLVRLFKLIDRGKAQLCRTQHGVLERWDVRRSPIRLSLFTPSLFTLHP